MLRLQFGWITLCYELTSLLSSKGSSDLPGRSIRSSCLRVVCRTDNPRCSIKLNAAFQTCVTREEDRPQGSRSSFIVADKEARLARALGSLSSGGRVNRGADCPRAYLQQDARRGYCIVILRLTCPNVKPFRPSAAHAYIPTPAACGAATEPSETDEATERTYSGAVLPKTKGPPNGRPFAQFGGAD